MKRSSTLLALVVLAAACGDSPAPDVAARPDRPHVARGALRDETGRALVLRGVNVSGVHKRKPYFDFHGPDDFKRIRDAWGMNAVRLLVSWSAIEPERGRYDDGYLAEVERRLGWAEDAGLYVVLDMHQDLYGEGFDGGNGAPPWTCDAARYAAYKPQTPWFLGYTDANVQACFDAFYTSDDLVSRFAAAWKHVAERLAAKKSVLGFDPMNEPSWGSYSVLQFEADRLQPLYERVVRAVREAAPRWIAFLEPGATRNLGLATRLANLPFADVVYAPHSYDRDAESGMGFDAKRRAAIVDNVAALASEARGLGAALWIGEYGGTASHPGIEAYMDAQFDAAGAVAAGTMYWHYGKDAGYGLLAADGSEKTNLLDVLVRPFPTTVAGDLESYAYDETSGALTGVYAPDTALAAPTEIATPTRKFPRGATVECRDCATEELPGIVRITRPPSDRPSHVIVRPR